MSGQIIRARDNFFQMKIKTGISGRHVRLFQNIDYSKNIVKTEKIEFVIGTAGFKNYGAVKQFFN